MTVKLLYLTDQYLDFLSDDILYGLRYLLGADVVDHPKKNILYASGKGKVDDSLIWAGGSTAFGLNDIEIDREDIDKKIRMKYFDWVINSNCWRIKYIGHENTVVLDGEDHGILHPMYIGRATAYYKRELLWKNSRTRPIQFSLPDHLLDLELLPKTQNINASFSVYPGQREELSKRFKVDLFSNWQEYRNNIKRSWFGISPKGAGYDCQRHYEILGLSVLCVYLDNNAPIILRKSFIDGENCITFNNIGELNEKIDKCKDPSSLIENGKEALLKYHLSSCRAKKILDDLTIMNPKKRYFPTCADLQHGFIPYSKRILHRFIRNNHLKSIPKIV